VLLISTGIEDGCSSSGEAGSGKGVSGLKANVGREGIQSQDSLGEIGVVVEKKKRLVHSENRRLEARR
jgi:hypothetical protein